MYAWTFFFFLVCMCFFPEDVHTSKAKGDEKQLNPLSSLRSHPSGLDLTLEDGCGPVVRTLTLDGSKAPLVSSGSQQSARTH